MKNIPWYIAAAAMIVLAFVLIRQCKGDTADIGYIKDSTQYWKNKYGQAVSSLKQKEQDFNVAQKGYLDSIAKLHNTQANRIKEAIELRLRGQATIKTGPAAVTYKPQESQVSESGDLIYECPEVASMSQVFTSPYYVANVTLRSGFDSSTLDIQTYDTVMVLTKIVREGNIFNRKRYIQIDARNANPYNIIEGMKVYRLPAPKPKKIGIGPQVGVTLDGSGKIKPFAGIGISYTLIRL
jgi:hypothetical protein